MPNCSECGKPVRSAFVTCEACRSDLAADIMSRLCDELCRWPLECETEEELQAHCDDCRIWIEIVNLAGGEGVLWEG